MTAAQSQPRGATQARGAIPLGRARGVERALPLVRKGESEDVAVVAARQACRDCAFVLMGFAHISPDALLKQTRGSAEEAFPRQVLMAGLVSELGFSPLTVGRAIGRDKATVEHACRIIEAIRGGIEPDHLIDILGPSGVQEFLGGFDGAEAFLDAAESLIDDFGVAFRLVAIKGAAYRGEVERRKTAAKEATR